MYIRKLQIPGSAPISKAEFFYAQMPPSLKKRPQVRASLFDLQKAYRESKTGRFKRHAGGVIAKVKQGCSGAQRWLFIRQRKKGANIKI